MVKRGTTGSGFARLGAVSQGLALLWSGALRMSAAGRGIARFCSALFWSGDARRSAALLGAVW